MEIRTYSADDETMLFDMLREEGPEWEDYWGNLTMERYRSALAHSIVFVAYECDELCGYVRCKDDDGFGIYIYDLLVKKSRRGENLGKAIIDKVCTSFPNNTVYVMSDVDVYYEKQGFLRIGSIFEANIHTKSGPPA